MRYLSFILFFLIFTSCSKEHRDLDVIISSGEVRFLTLNTPTTYFENSDGEMAGYEYEVATRFSQWLGLSPKFVVVDSVEELFHGLKLGRGDVIAAGISITDERLKEFDFAPSYQTIKQQVICRPYVRPRKVKDLVGLNIAVMGSTSYVEKLQSYKKKYPELSWVELTGQTDFQLYQDINEEKYDCTISDSNIASIARRPYPNLEIPMSLDVEDKLAWVFNKELDAFEGKLDEYFRDHFSSSARNELEEKYYGHTRQFDPYDTQVFQQRITERLPQYIDLFKEASKEYGWSWQLLAAISYQESQWDPEAKSPTGVRGLMMLTRATAKEVGVKDRLDPKESIMGGARYLTQLKKRIPNHIDEQDQVWMTFAAYNIGYQHLRNARAVAVWRDLNPNSWANVRQALPLLTQKKVYKYLPNGFARGGEPVVYVDRIRHYYDVIKKFESQL